MQLRHHNIQKKFKNRPYGTFHFYSAPLCRGQPPVQGPPEYFFKAADKMQTSKVPKKKQKKLGCWNLPSIAGVQIKMECTNIIMVKQP